MEDNAHFFGVDYLDTYAPVVKHYSIRLVLAIVSLNDLKMIKLDIKTAFLYGELEEELYLQQPEGYIIPGKEDWVCNLLKPLYMVSKRRQDAGTGNLMMQFSSKNSKDAFMIRVYFTALLQKERTKY